jgi:hypothetical protein
VEPGWYIDPMRRFEYRYFNGVQWTSDVSVNGQRYVDSPVAQPILPAPTPPRHRGKAIASMVLGISAVALGWVPFVFALAAAAAVAAIVFGVLGLKSARRNDGYGHGFAVAGLTLAPIALAVCVGGFFFTRVVLREVRNFLEPGPHEVFVQQPCTVDHGTATLHGTIRNLDDHQRDYRIEIDFDNGDDAQIDTVPVLDVAAGATASWTSTVEISGTSITCEVSKVYGPLPFDIDVQP